MSRFLDSISTIISIFHQHTKEDGDHSKLSRRQMKEFIQREFADVIAKPHDPQTIDKILQFLEWDGDGEIDFNEFLLLVFRVAKACYWYLPKGPYLRQRTKLTTSGKSLQEPEIKNRGSHQHHQEEEEQQTRESNRHPRCEPELQGDTRVEELETQAEMGRHHQQRNTESRNEAKRISKLGQQVPQAKDERSQEPCEQWNSQRRREPPEPDRRGDVQPCKRSTLQTHEPGLREKNRQNLDGPQPEQLADVRSRSQSSEPQPLPNRWSSRQPHEQALPAYNQHQQQPQGEDRETNNQPRKPELLTEERTRYHLRELEQTALADSSHEPRQPECLKSRRPHQSYLQEPLEFDRRYYDKCDPEREIHEKEKNEQHEIQYPEKEEDMHQDKEWEERDDIRREKPLRERRVDRQRELEIDVYERRSRQTREREERDATAEQRETRDRRVCETREREGDGRRRPEAVRYERTRETVVAEAEADVKIHRESRELEPREDIERREYLREGEDRRDERRICRGREREEPLRERRVDRQRELEIDVYERRSRQTREREERDATAEQRETRDRRICETREREGDGRRRPEAVRYERTRETVVAEAEADVKIHRESRELEPREDIERREYLREGVDRRDERRICRGRERGRAPAGEEGRSPTGAGDRCL
ncbi:trichohyalin-like [Falco rusticolus]|uniref:trichohyalin-like n=1 Tax=Falco rusticolus TaxID=120794 RepID=UPI0018867773|nr:trichohyalin-like [Falco rusticolus]